MDNAPLENARICPTLLTAKKSSNETEQSYSPVLSKKSCCWGDHCCSALSPALMYALGAARRGWVLGVSSRPGFSGRWQLSLPERHQESRAGPRKWLVICFSISALLLNPLSLLVKTNMHSLTSRCFCWLNAHGSRCSQGRAGAICRLGRKGGFLPRPPSSAATL